MCSGYTPNDQAGEVAAAARRYVGGHVGLSQPKLHLELFDIEEIVRNVGDCLAVNAS
jgi:hypothetical protein